MNRIEGQNQNFFENFFTEEAKIGERKVLITGGSSGIGEALVRTFAEAGENVYFTFNTGEDRAQKLVKELEKYSVTAFHYDQGNAESLKELLGQFSQPVEVLILNAAYGSKTIETASSDRIQQEQIMMQVNAVGPLLLTQAFLPSMRENRYGKIVFISSVGGGITHFPGFRHSDGMSKAAIAYLAKHIGAELVHEPIDVFAVCPGATDTPMLRKSTLDHLNNEDRSALIQRLPDGRLIKPEEIAQLCYVLCSTKAARLLRGSVVDASLGLGGNPGLIAH